MKTIKHTISQINTTGGSASMTITLPEPPWGALEVDDRSDTAPRQPMIRDSTYKLKGDKAMSLAAYAGVKSDQRGKSYDAAQDLVDMIRT